MAGNRRERQLQGAGHASERPSRPTLALATASSGALTATVLHPGALASSAPGQLLTVIVVGTALALVPSLMVVVLVGPSLMRALDAGSDARAVVAVAAPVALIVSSVGPLLSQLVGDQAHEEHSTVLHLLVTGFLALVGTAPAAWLVLRSSSHVVGAPASGRAPSRIRTTH